MKRHVVFSLLAAVMAFLIGYNIGFHAMLVPSLKRTFSDMRDTQFFASAISIATLDRLERGDVEGAKRLLATNLAGYYRSDDSRRTPQAQAVRTHIEKVSAHSLTLKQMLESP